MISKKVFVQSLNDLEEQVKIENKVNEILKKSTELGFFSISSLLQSSFVKLLEEAMGDTDDYLSYWVWECDFGKRYGRGKKELCAYDSNNRYIDIKTPEKLYDYITKNYVRPKNKKQ